MVVILYKLDLSPPARAAMMMCDILNVPVEMRDVDLLRKEQFNPEFLKKNPLHTIPVLEDGDLVINDSHAILIYLADKYGKDDSLYPKDLIKRTLVNQKLFFDTGILFPRLRSVAVSVIMERVKTVSEKQLSDIDEAFSFVEEFLSRTKYIAIDDLTISDISAYADITFLVYVVPLDVSKYPKTHAWMKEMEQKPFAQKYNAQGAADLGQLFKKALES